MSKPKRKLTAAEKAAKRKRQREFKTIFVNGKQKRVRREQTIDGMPAGEFLARNADPVWLLQNGMYEELYRLEMEQQKDLPEPHSAEPRQMRIETDPRVVRKLAQEREDDNWEFRTFLKGSELEAEELDAIVHRHYEEVARQIDCCDCGNCCREVTPILRRDDVDRLASGMDVSREELIERLSVTEQNDVLVFADGPCPLLSGKRCSVYEYRPGDCRSFPHLHKEEFVSRLMNVVQNCSICPIVFNVYERLKEELGRAPDDS